MPISYFLPFRLHSFNIKELNKLIVTHMHQSYVTVTGKFYLIVHSKVPTLLSVHVFPHYRVLKSETESDMTYNKVW